jgi:hypothetical protein
MAPPRRLLAVVAATVAAASCTSAFTVVDPSSVARRPLSSRLSVAATDFFEDDHHHDEGNQFNRRRSDDEDMLSASGSSRRSNTEEEEPDSSREQQSTNKFVTGDALHKLRHKVLALRLELQEARQEQPRPDLKRIRHLERAILEIQQVDAEFVYSVSLERMEAAQREGRFQEAERYHEQAMEARNSLPAFQLDGLWVGKFSDTYELINVTYVGDTLIAHKVTGSKNVPKGEASFEVDLSPINAARRGEVLEPIELGDAAARQWGCRFLQRYAGRGQVAAEGYVDSQWVGGQLILVNDYFSFAWLPIGHQVFFGRPTPELILKLHKKQEDENADRKFLERCWEETEHVQDDLEVSAIDQQDYYTQVGCFQ